MLYPLKKQALYSKLKQKGGDKMKELLEAYQMICANVQSLIVGIGLLLLLLWPIKCIIDKVAHKIFFHE